MRTVPPEVVTDRALDIHDTYPNKRLIVHYLQPHYPFIGETGQALDHGTVVEITTDGEQKQTRDSASVWDRLESGTVDEQQVWQAYRENLELVLPAVERLIGNIDGRSVVSSDHGNAFGRFGVYGHPMDTYLRSLVEVPWLVRESGSRRNIQAGERSSTDTDDEELINDRLRHLGYTE